MLSACTTASVSKDRACYAPEWEWGTYTAEVLNAVPGAKYTELPPAQVQKWLDAYNASGDPSGAMWNRVGWFSRSDSPMGRLIIGVGDCVWVSTVIPAIAMQEFLGKGV